VSEAEIARLRDEIADVDRGIVGLVAKRLHIAEQLGVEKKLLGLPVVVPDTEDRVFTRLLTESATRGITLSFAEGLARLLIDESVRVQDLVRLPPSAKRRILVVGGAGSMGRWLSRYFRSRGYEVVVHDIAGPVEDYPFEPDLRKGVRAADVVAVAVPMTACGEVLEQIAAVEPSALVFDVASLKAPIEKQLRSMGAAGLRIASIHPVFGPDLWPLSSGNITFSDVGNSVAVLEVKELFRPSGASFVDVSLDHHDVPAEPESSLFADFRPMRRPEPVRSRGPASVRRDDLLPALRCGLRPARRPAGVAPGHPGPEPPHPARPPANPRRLG